MNEAKDVFN